MDDSWRADLRRNKILVNIDEGCGFEKIGGLHLQGEEDPETVKIDTIQLQPGRNEIEQKSVFDVDGHLLCGEERVALWLRQNPGEASQVIENWKLALCNSYKDSWTVKKVYKALRADHGEIEDVREFLTVKLRQVRIGIRAWYKDKAFLSMKYPPQYWDEIHIEAKVTVPCMWDARPKCIMRNAATAAGFYNVQLLLEPLCAAALDIQSFKEAGCLKYGASIAWMDTGCATTDLATVRVNEPKTSGGRCQMEIVGIPTGHLLGSHVVQGMAWEYVQTCQEIINRGGMRRTLLTLGNMSKEEFSRQVSKEVEIRKKIHPVEDFSIAITAMADWRVVPAGVSHMSIRIEGDRLLSWLEKWTSMLGDSLTKYLAAPGQNEVRDVVLTGGGSKNATVRAGLQEVAKVMGIRVFDSPALSPVAHGGLRQYPQRLAEPLPAEGYWYITRSAEFDTRWHADVIKCWNYVQETKVDASGEIDGFLDEYRMVPLTAAGATRNPLKKNDWIVHDRLTPIMSRKDGVSTTHNVPMHFYPDADSGSRFTFDIYYSDFPHEDMEPLRDCQGLIHPEFKPIQITCANLPSLEGAGFEEEQLGKDYVFHIYGLIRMTAQDDHLDLDITLFKPGLEPEYVDGQLDMTKPLPAVFHNEIVEVWDINRSHIIPDSQSLDATNVSNAEAAAQSRDRTEAEVTVQRTRQSTKRSKGVSPSKIYKKSATPKNPRKGPGRPKNTTARQAQRRLPTSSEVASSHVVRGGTGNLSTPSLISAESSPALRRSNRQTFATEKASASGTGSGSFNTPKAPLS